MKCRYCKAQSSSEFCSKEHKRTFYENIENAMNTHCPVIVGKDLGDKEKRLQEEFKRRVS